MADNKTAEEPDGTDFEVATDEVAGVNFQKVKLDVGAAGASALLSTTNALPATIYSGGVEIDFDAPVGILGVDGTGIATNANPFPISDAGSSLTVDGTVTATQPTAANLNATVTGSGSTATPATGLLTVQGNVADDAAGGTTNPVPVGGRYVATPTSYTDGDRATATFDNKGHLRVAIFSPDANSSPQVSTVSDTTNVSGLNWLYTSGLLQLYSASLTTSRLRSIDYSFGAPSGVAAVEQAGASYLVKSDATGSAVKASAGILHKVIINTLSAGSITLYDALSATGTPFAVINSGVEREITYDLGFATGLWAVFSSTPNVTFVYR